MSKLRPAPDPGSRIDSAGLRLLGKECPHHLDQRTIRIGYYNSGASARVPARELFRHEHRGGSGGPEIRCISRRYGKGERVRPGLIQRTNGVNANRPIAKQAATDEVGDRLRGETAGCHATSCLI